MNFAGLSTIHDPFVRRLAQRRVRGSGAGRYVAVGRSPDVRAAFADRLRRELGADNAVLEHTWCGSDFGPWNELQTRRNEEGESASAVWQLFGVGSGPRADFGLRALNLARDAWGAFRAHVVVWLDDGAAFRRFTELCPDLLSQLDGYEFMLGADDFSPPAEWAPRWHAASLAAERREVELLEAGPMDSLQAAVNLHDVATSLAERNERLRAEPMFREAGARLPPHADRLATLVAVAHGEVALQLDRQPVLPIQPLPEVPGLVECAEAQRARFRGDPDQLRKWRRAISLAAPETMQAWISNAAQAAISLGLPPPRVTGQAYIDGLALDALSAGRLLEALPALQQSLETHLAAGRLRQARGAWLESARLLDLLGVLPHAPPPLGDDAATVGPNAAHWLRLWRRGLLTDETAALTRQVLRLDENGLGRATAATALKEVAAVLREEASGHDAEVADWAAVAALVHQSAVSQRDDDALGPALFARVNLALIGGDRTTAWWLADRKLMGWARRCRGSLMEAGVFCILADACPDPRRGVELAAAALRRAPPDEAPLLHVGAQRQRARALVRLGDVPGAESVLHAALTMATRVRLELTAAEVRVSLAELPIPDRVPVAEAAVDAARQARLPRLEAQALVALARATPGPAALPLLDRAEQLAAELGPPRTLAAIHALRHDREDSRASIIP